MRFAQNGINITADLPVLARQRIKITIRALANAERDMYIKAIHKVLIPQFS
jgi:hypothetical protein